MDKSQAAVQGRNRDCQWESASSDRKSKLTQITAFLSKNIPDSYLSSS